MSRLKELRKEKGWTQVQLQIKTGIEQQNISSIENGKRSISAQQYKMFALLFDTSVDYLMELTDVKEPYPRKKEASDDAHSYS